MRDDECAEERGAEGAEGVAVCEGVFPSVVGVGFGGCAFRKMFVNSR